PRKAGAKTLNDLVPADGEAAPLALENLLGLEGRQQGVANEELGDLSRLGRHGAAGACLGDVRAQALVVHDTALLDETQKLVGGSRGGHGDDSARATSAI